MSTVFLAFHAEKLHVGKVWERTLRMAQALARRNCSCTFFVYPYRAILEGVDLSKRLAALRHLGHEVAQHTHFYAGNPDSGKKTDDLSPKNVRDCVSRDFFYLTKCGSSPRGFTAGGWAFPQSLLPILANLGFTYDCSTRLPLAFNQASGRVPCLYLERPKSVDQSIGGDGNQQIVLLPTTCSLARWYRARFDTVGLPAYPLIYLHDYDLLRLPIYILARYLDSSAKKNSIGAVRNLIELVVPEPFDSVYFGQAARTSGM